jgi:hypothetical protein
MKLSLLILFFLTTLYASAQQNYDASLIPKELLPYASSVVRDDETSVEVKDLDNVIYHYKLAVTILNKNGDDMALIQFGHNKNFTVKNIKGFIYNSAGIQIAKFSQSDFEDTNDDDNGSSLFQDVKSLRYQASTTDYPYTISYECEFHSKQTLAFGNWEPNAGTGIAVEKSTYTFLCKKDFNIRYKELNLSTPVSTSTNKNLETVYSWQANNLKAIRNEPYEPSSTRYITVVKIAPEKFQFENYVGNFTNWNELGKCIYDKLLVNRDQLPVSAIENVKQITSGITDPKLKAKKIYEYMQNKTRYVSIQVGIGGFQPFPATDVDQLNYGDCKALVNYTQALLKVAGIPSYYCEVMADRDDKTGLIGDFASADQTNHIILCIPFKNDTTWCDCTNQIIPFGYLGNLTDDRTVLACTPEGGKILHTPRYTALDNIQQRKANFVLSETGELSGNMTTIFKGIEYDDRDWIIQKSLTEQLKIISEIYPITNLDIQKLEYKQDKSFDPVTTENIDFKAPEYASTDDGKITFMLNAANRRYSRPKQVMNRKTDVYINEGYTDEDEIIYTLPAGYHPEYTPSEVILKKPFGNFKVTSTVKDGKLIYKRKLQLIDGTYPKDTYGDLVDFFQSVVDADASTVTLIKNN